MSRCRILYALFTRTHVCVLEFLSQLRAGEWSTLRMVCAAVLASVLLSSHAEAAVVTRGPYLQLGTPTSLVIRWRTDQPSASRVWYGEQADSLIGTAELADATTEHEVAVSGLASGKRYFYAVGSLDERLAGDASYCFTTAPVAGTAGMTRIWVTGDAGTGDAKQAAVRDAYLDFAHKSRGADVWLMLGDNAYAKGTDADYDRGVFGVYGLPLRQTVLWSTLGNHDTDQKTDFRGDYPYFRLFTFPQRGEAGGLPSGTEHYYSFDRGAVHFITLDAQTAARTPASDMVTWLKNDLAATKQRWILAFWHHSPYSKGSHDTDTDKVAIEFRSVILPVLESGGADLVMTGHSHSYERSYLLHGHYGLSTTLVAENKLDSGKGDADAPYIKTAKDQGTLYVVAGTAGKVSGGSLDHPAMCVSLNKLGSLIVDIDGDRLRGRFLREDGTINDDFSLVKKY